MTGPAGDVAGADRLLDTLHTVETPEGVRVALRTAGPVARALAYGIDASVRAVVYFVSLVLLAATVPALSLPLLMLLFFALEWFYPVLFEMYGDGQTLGKRAVGLRVVCEDGTPVTWASSMLRNLLLSADMVPGTFLVGLVSSLSTEGHRRVGDLAAGTLVIHADCPRPQSGAAAAAVEVPIEPAFGLGLAEQQAVVSLAERATVLSPARVEELAGLATPLHAAGRTARGSVLGVAAWLVGRGGGAAR